jgi:hypothetical protein
VNEADSAADGLHGVRSMRLMNIGHVIPAGERDRRQLSASPIGERDRGR